MINYEGIIRAYIASGDYVLEQIDGRIDTLWVEGKITDEQRAALKQFAADNAIDTLQIDFLAKLAQIEKDIWELKHPVDQFPVWQQGQVSVKGQPYRFDVTGDGELDLVRYDGGRASTSLSVGKIEGWHMLDRELNVVATITRDADGGYVIVPIPEPEPETDGDSDDANTEG